MPNCQSHVDRSYCMYSVFKTIFTEVFIGLHISIDILYCYLATTQCIHSLTESFISHTASRPTSISFITPFNIANTATR